MGPIKRLMLLVSILLFFLLSGCQNAFGFINARWISEISLAHHLENVDVNEAPPRIDTFKDAVFIRTMADAMNSSEVIQGDLDYGVEFNMKLTYGDGYTENYYLSLGEEKGYNGLLLSAKNSSKGYSIPVKHADLLRKLIYQGEGSAEAEDEEAKVRVTVNAPVTISRNDLFQVTGVREFINLELLNGEYSEDWTTTAPLTGRKWSGQFRLVVTDDQGQPLSTLSLSKFFSEELSFGDGFPLQFGDYNSDGHPDFTIGQYGSSNGSFFKLFTLNEDHTIHALVINGNDELFVSSPDRYSVKLKEVAGGFMSSYYDNAAGKQREDTYQWDGNVFQKVN